MLVAGFRQLCDEVSSKWRCFFDVVCIAVGIKQRKALVVLRGNHKVGHAAFFCKLYPLLRIKINRVERTRKLFHFAVRDGKSRLNPFTVVVGRTAPSVLTGEHGIESEVDHHAVFRFAKPFDIVHAFSARLPTKKIAQPCFLL